MVQNPALVEATLSIVERPLLTKLKSVRAEIDALKNEREDNVQRAAAVGGDEKLTQRRRDIDSKLEELEALCKSIEVKLPAEDGQALVDLLRVRQQADAVEVAKVEEAKAKVNETYRVLEEHIQALQAAQRQADIVHGRVVNVHAAMRLHREHNPEIYDPTVERSQTPRLLEAAS